METSQKGSIQMYFAKFVFFGWIGSGADQGRGKINQTQYPSLKIFSDKTAAWIEKLITS